MCSKQHLICSYTILTYQLHKTTTTSGRGTENRLFTVSCPLTVWHMRFYLFLFHPRLIHGNGEIIGIIIHRITWINENGACLSQSDASGGHHIKLGLSALHRLQYGCTKMVYSDSPHSVRLLGAPPPPLFSLTSSIAPRTPHNSSSNTHYSGMPTAYLYVLERATPFPASNLAISTASSKLFPSKQLPSRLLR